MPRKRQRAKSRNFNPHPLAHAWLIGAKYPEDKEPFAYMALGLNHVDTAITRGIHRDGEWRPIEPGDVSQLNAGETRYILPALKRLRKLYDAAPDHVRRKVPAERRALLEAVDNI